MIDTLAQEAGSSHSAGQALPDSLSADPETLVLQAVKNDPFATIREIKQEINDRSDRVRLGWWEVFGILRRNHLLARRARFRFSRNRL